MPIDAMRMGELRGKFAKLDKNGDRKLNFEEMSSLLRRGNPDMDDKELKMIYDNVDKNHDGLIDFDEFADFLLSKTGESRSAPSDLKGPERFYYDKSSYTGVRSHAGGPSTVDSGGDLRDQVRGGHHTGGTSMRGGVSDNVRQHVEKPLMQTEPPGGANHPRQPRPPATEHPGDPRGPERFYHDKSSYTGVARNGGPSTLDNKEDFREQVRGGMHTGATAMRNPDAVPKEPERPLMQTEPPGGAVRHREPRTF